MLELEKILNELEKQVFSAEVYNDDFDGTYIGNLICLGNVREVLEDYFNDGWISVEERLPERTLDEKINKSYKKYLVFIDSVDGWDIDMALYDFWNDKKWREAHDGYGEIENVIAWRPLPEPYRPERSEGK